MTSITLKWFIFLLLQSIFNFVSSQKLAVVVIDGLAANTFYKFSHLSVFRTFEEEGIWSTKVFPVFPTFSVSNRHSLLTGTLPRRHGLIGDFIHNWRDNLKFQNFTADSDFSRDWWSIDPIYISALRSSASVAMFFFPECDVDWDVAPQICVPPRTDGKTFADESQAKRVIQATKEHDLTLIYHPWIGEEIRRKGVHHTNEKHSKEVLRFAQSLERLTAQARERVDLNVIVVSTHGFIDVPRKNIRVIDEYVPMELIETTVGSGAIKQLQVKKGKTHQVYSQLHDHHPIPNVHVYYTTPKTGDLPEHYHFKKSDIVADLVLLADPGYAVVTKDEKKQFPKPKLHEITAAIDGYNNELPDVLGVFLGYGPAFRVGYRKGPIQLFDIYSLMCSLLSIEDSCNHTPGRILRIDDVLTSDARVAIRSTSSFSSLPSFYVTFVMLFSVIILLF
ncbi:hypothetical protein L5515_011292 [Caenorhabditis briggsae]|uniref:glycerophosphocholine cholinephosphodiesterase n=1 Tax=Caenorhabditis briggsae TaxID=6238 RepID=A0AAE9JG59_CAEBR|nr:hypothetical protein L5515_011292 [Caenorhabditis briggsae]